MDKNVLQQFRRNPDGSWTPLVAMAMKFGKQSINVLPLMVFNRGLIYMGVDVAAELDRLDGNG